MTRNFTAAAVCSMLLTGALCWHVLTSGNAEWLRVETPSYALSSMPFNIKVILPEPEAGTYLGADLHWMTGDKVSRGYMSGSRPVAVKAGQYVYELSIPVRPESSAAFIFPVFVLSRYGTWSSRISAAESGPVPVLECSSDRSLSPLNPVTAREISDHQREFKPESRPLIFITAGIWIAAALICMAGRSQFQAGWIAAAALISAVWEAFSISTVSVNFLRSIALHAGAYSGRREPQQILTIAAAAAVGLLILYLFSSPGRSRRGILLLSLSAFWVVSLLRILSLHETDQLLEQTIMGIGAGQIIKITASLVFLASIVIFIIKRNRKVLSSGS